MTPIKQPRSCATAFIIPATWQAAMRTYFTYVGRLDDVFKCSDYRISPFELESVLIEHRAVAEAAVVPSPDPLRLRSRRLLWFWRQGEVGDSETARSILEHVRGRVAPFKRIRRIEFAELPKTISGRFAASSCAAPSTTGRWGLHAAPRNIGKKILPSRRRGPGQQKVSDSSPIVAFRAQGSASQIAAAIAADYVDGATSVVFASTACDLNALGSDWRSEACIARSAPPPAASSARRN